MGERREVTLSEATESLRDGNETIGTTGQRMGKREGKHWCALEWGKKGEQERDKTIETQTWPHVIDTKQHPRVRGPSSRGKAQAVTRALAQQQQITTAAHSSAQSGV